MAINIVEEDGGAVRDITNANTDCPWGRYGGDCVCHTHGRRIPLSSLAAKPIIIDRQQVTIDFHRCLLINGKRVRHLVVNSSKHFPVVFITDSGAYVLEHWWQVTFDA